MKEKKFSPPRHWVDLEELREDYWTDDNAMEKRGQEFTEKPLEALEKLDNKGVARRDFLTLMGASMAMATFSCARRPVNKIIPYVVKPEEVTPGVANHYASTCQGCASNCGTLVKTRESRPIKIEGNPSHPSNAGKLCVRGQASVLGLYDPDRLRHAVSPGRTGGTSRAEWGALDQKIVSKFQSARSVRLLTGPISGPARQKLIKDFVRKYNGKHVEFEIGAGESISEAQLASYGSPMIPDYRFDRADVVLSLGADFLGDWLSPVEHSRAWAKKRKLQNQVASQAQMSRLYTFETTMTVTGANSDERFAVRPGDELKIALAIANEIVGNSRFASNGGLKKVLRTYDAKRVADEVQGDVSSKKIVEIARRLWNSRGKSLVVGGGIHGQTTTDVQLQIAVNLLNEILGAEGKTVDAARAKPGVGGYQALDALGDELGQGKVDVLVVSGINPVYQFPGFAEKMKKAGTIVVVDERVTETGAIADHVLGAHHALENWGDASPYDGVYSLQQPTISPLGDTRSLEDNLLAWTGQKTSWHDYLKNHWKGSLYSQFGGGKGFEAFWIDTLKEGLVKKSSFGSKTRSFRQNSISQLVANRQSGGELRLALYSKLSIQDGRDANNPWLQETPDPISTVTWDNYLNVSPKLAKQMKLVQNDVVELTADSGAVRVPVHVQPGLHPNVVSLAVGYGRTHAGKIGNGVGVNAYRFVRKSGNRISFSGHNVKLAKTGSRYELAAVQGHHRTRNRPIVNDITLTAYRRNPADALHTSPHVREKLRTMWTEHQYPGHKWGMNIDLNSCTGCSACVVACQAENNVPIVGRDRVRTGREMHWIRIDRYYSGSEDSPDVAFQPMICQHCDNAPCETVCPVLATTHSSEGINEMTYNRCVGTRYCQNNCPYKVRRFNFFDHWLDYKETMNLVWNPDVTVRTRGVMEKCTFCVQRIQKAKNTAENEGRKVKDGEIQTACQQTCPTDAIQFGDMNAESSMLASLKRNPRDYRVLESVNAKPSVSYLTKVRNKEMVKAHGEHEHHS